MQPRQTLILAAMQPEADAVARAVAGVAGVSVGVVGIGARDVPAISRDQTSLVLLACLAGGLDPALRTGDVVVDPPPAILPPGARVGRIHTADRLVSTVAEKAALFAATGAACVDMETAGVRRAADAAGVRLVAVRAILDTAREPLPAYVLGLTDARGRPRVGRVTRLLLRRPWAIRDLVRLGRTSKRALRSLGEAVRELVLRART